RRHAGEVPHRPRGYRLRRVLPAGPRPPGDGPGGLPVRSHRRCPRRHDFRGTGGEPAERWPSAISREPGGSSGGRPIDEALRDNPPLEFKRLPSYSPQLNPIERFWKKLRRRATHNRLFDTLADLKASLRASLCYFQTM